VIYVINRESALKSKLNLLVMSVAASDLVIGIFVIPLGLIAVRTFTQSSSSSRRVFNCSWQLANRETSRSAFSATRS
jgi:hypothetical protein